MRRILPLAVLVVASAARAQEGEEIPEKRLAFVERNPMLTMSGPFTEAFDPELLDQLTSGFATTVVLRAYVYKRGSDVALWWSAATWRVVYDLWAETYLIQIRDYNGERNYTEKKKAEALRLATTMNELPVAPLAVLVPEVEYFVGVEIEINPVSPELLAQVRRWLVRPALGGASFFGGFVSIFLNPKVAEADRTLRFRSQVFYRVKKK